MSMPHHERRAARRGLAAGAIVALALALTGCSPYWLRGEEEATAVADWIEGLPGVIAAESTAGPSPFNGWLRVEVDVEPSLSDPDLTDLVRRTEEHCRGLGWPQVSISYTAGDSYTFGDDPSASLQIFLDLRAERRYDGIDVAGTVAVELDRPDAGVGELLATAEHLQEVAADAGGVQSNLEVRASSGPLTVRGTADILPLEGAALLGRLARSGVPWTDASVFATAYGDQPVWITVETEEQRAALLALASTAMVPGTSQEDALPGGVILSDTVELQTFLEDDLDRYR